MEFLPLIFTFVTSVVFTAFIVFLLYNNCFAVLYTTTLFVSTLITILFLNNVSIAYYCVVFVLFVCINISFIGVFTYIRHQIRNRKRKEREERDRRIDEMAKKLKESK